MRVRTVSDKMSGQPGAIVSDMRTQVAGSGYMPYMSGDGYALWDSSVGAYVYHQPYPQQQQQQSAWMASSDASQHRDPRDYNQSEVKRSHHRSRDRSRARSSFVDRRAHVPGDRRTSPIRSRREREQERSRSRAPLRPSSPPSARRAPSRARSQFHPRARSPLRRDRSRSRHAASPAPKKGSTKKDAEAEAEDEDGEVGGERDRSFSRSPVRKSVQEKKEDASAPTPTPPSKRDVTAARARALVDMGVHEEFIGYMAWHHMDPADNNVFRTLDAAYAHCEAISAREAAARDFAPPIGLVHAVDLRQSALLRSQIAQLPEPACSDVLATVQSSIAHARSTLRARADALMRGVNTPDIFGSDAFRVWQRDDAAAVAAAAATVAAPPPSSSALSASPTVAMQAVLEQLDAS